MRKLFGSLLLFGSIACNMNSSDKNLEGDNVIEELPTEQDHTMGDEVLDVSREMIFRVTDINGFPEELRGCSCYFARNQAHLDQQKFIYIDAHHRKPAFISIDGQLYKLNGVNEAFTADVKIDSEKNKGDKTSRVTGELTVTDSTGRSVTIPFVGECGC